MCGHRYGAPFGGRPLHARGPWGRRRRGGILPYLAAAFLVRAALRRGRRVWGPKYGPWGWDQGQGPHGSSEQGHGRPWGRGGWRRGHEHGRGRGSAWRLRAEVGPLVGLLRDAFRRGGLDDRQVDEIGAVLRDARGRIAAILGATRPPSTEL
jgi:hypothetical protein